MKMKLQNKKTREIGYLRSTNWNEKALIIMAQNGAQLAKYNSLAELNAEWEDYDEPKESKEHYFIAEYGSVYPMNVYEDYNNVEDFDDYKEIGNYFETKEEAEKAVEKLKAWTRLKDKGFRLNHWKEAQLRPNMSYVAITGNMNVDEEAKADLDLLFGGEE